jgi:hypothetical protein
MSTDRPLYYCTGFMAFKPSPLSEDLLQKWTASLKTPDINQVKFNSLVKKSAIRHKYLPRKEFPDGKMYLRHKSCTIIQRSIRRRPHVIMAI